MPNIIKTNVAEIRQRIIKDLSMAIYLGNDEIIVKIFKALSDQDAASILSLLNKDSRAYVVNCIKKEITQEILGYLSEEHKAEVLHTLNSHKRKGKENIAFSNRETFTENKISETVKAISEYNKEAIYEIFSNLNPVDAATIIEFLVPKQRILLIKMLGNEFDGRILTFIELTVLHDIIEKIDPKLLAFFLYELDQDDIIEIIQEMSHNQQQILLTCLSKLVDKESLRAIKKSLYYEEGTAGRIMQPVMSFLSSCSVKSAYQRFCANKRISKETQMIYVYENIDHKFALVGQIHFLDLCKLNSNKDTKADHLGQHMEDVSCTIFTNTEFHEIAFLFRKYYVFAIPVMNHNFTRLLGVINILQAINILESISNESVLALGGIEEFDFYSNIYDTVITRLRSLGIASVATLISTSVISVFQETLQQNIQLASILPIAGAIGGNSACQVLTITVRALSNQEINSNNIPRVIRKEVISGLGSGLVIGAVMAFWYWFTGYGTIIPAILMFSLIINIMWAGFIGSFIPIVLDRYFNKDPALASVGLNIMTDAMGFLALLSMARFLLKV